MNKEKINVNKLKKLIILLVAVLLVLVIVIIRIVFSKENIAIRNNKELNNVDKSYSEYIMPLNRLELTDKYSGKLTNETIFSLMYEFCIDTIPEFAKIDNISKYYKNNSNYIYIKTGIDNEEEFTTLVNKIQAMNTQDLEYSEHKIKEDSVSKNDGKYSAIMEVYYNNSEKNVEITVTLENKKIEERTSVLFK